MRVYKHLQEKTNEILEKIKEIYKTGIHLRLPSYKFPTFSYTYNKKDDTLTVIVSDIEIPTIEIPNYMGVGSGNIKINSQSGITVTNTGTPINTNPASSSTAVPTAYVPYLPVGNHIHIQQNSDNVLLYTIEIVLNNNNILSLKYIEINQHYFSVVSINGTGEGAYAHGGKVKDSVLFLDKTKLLVNGKFMNTDESPEVFMSELNDEGDSLSLLYLYDIANNWSTGE